MQLRSDGIRDALFFKRVCLVVEFDLNRGINGEGFFFVPVPVHAKKQGEENPSASEPSDRSGAMLVKKGEATMCFVVEGRSGCHIEYFA